MKRHSNKDEVRGEKRRIEDGRLTLSCAGRLGAAALAVHEGALSFVIP